MKIPSVRVPVSLLLDPSLHPSAKLAWIAVRQGAPAGPALVQARSGLSRPTVLKALTELAAAHWCSVSPGNGARALVRGPAGTWVSIPSALLADRQVGIRGKLLYAILQLIPELQFTHASLATRARASTGAVKRAIDDLVPAGWLRVTQANRLAPIRFELGNPELARGLRAAARVRARVDEAEYRGEALMHEYLSLLVASDQFEDNARPGFLVNPLTNERMELDRFYTSGVAFEFNGPQHFGATDQYTEEDAARQRARDFMKIGICATLGIRLVVIQAADLSLKTMRQKVTGLLPLRDLDDDWAVIEYLDEASRRYREKAKRKGKAART